MVSLSSLWNQYFGRNNREILEKNCIYRIKKGVDFYKINAFFWLLATFLYNLKSKAKIILSSAFTKSGRQLAARGVVA